MTPHPCRSCGALIFYATTPDGRKMPLDAQPQKRFVTRPSRDVRDEIDCKLVETYTTVTLSDVTPNRATVTAVRAVSASEIEPNRETGRSPITERNYAVVTDVALVPEVGERVWIDDGSTRSGGERTITARA